MIKLHVEINGMMCDQCVVVVRKALTTLPGVIVQRVQLGSAELEYDPELSDIQQILDAVGDEGYDAFRA